jgi:hypothetical protein
VAKTLELWNTANSAMELFPDVEPRVDFLPHLGAVAELCAIMTDCAGCHLDDDEIDTNMAYEVDDEQLLDAFGLADKLEPVA